MGPWRTATRSPARVTKNSVVALGLAGASKRNAIRAGLAGLALEGLAGAGAARALAPAFWSV